jgi:hypothetical protein
MVGTPYYYFYRIFFTILLLLELLRNSEAFFQWSSSINSISTATSAGFTLSNNNKLMSSTTTNKGELVVSASTNPSDDDDDDGAVLLNDKKRTNIIAYRSAHISIKSTNDKEIKVPVSMWYPIYNDNLQNSKNNYIGDVKYRYTISISKVAKLIAGWKLPRFLKRNFELDPMMMIVREEDTDKGIEEVSQIVNGVDTMDLPTTSSTPILLLAHGYLGSRWDLCHIAEEMSHYGFLCLSPEYPESLAASYEQEGILLDRATITSRLLQTIQEEWKIQPTGYGIIGHSLGCGTVMSTGDETWVRVCIAGPPATPSSSRTTTTSTVTSDSPILCIASKNDGAVSWTRRIEPYIIQQKFIPLEEDKLQDDIPHTRSVYVFSESPSSPNHISFLAENVNNAMISFLSFLLPIARAFQLPVLDFDKYRESRDSIPTATKVVPLVRKFLLQKMVIR